MKRWGGRAIALVAAAALGLAGVGPAGADDIANTIDGSIDATAESIVLTAGGSTGAVSFLVSATNGDGKNGCNLTGSTTLVVAVSSSNTARATVSPASLTFGSCSDVRTVTVTPVAAGSASISLSQTSNSTAGTFNLAPASFDVTVQAAAPTNTAPVLTVPASPITVEAGSAAGAVVTYAVSAADAQDDPDPAPLCGPASGSLFPLGDTTVSCAVTDSGGLSDTGTFTVRVVDSTDPSVQISTDAVAAANGWYDIASSGTAGITVSVTASDAVGIADLACTVDGASSSLAPGTPITLTDGDQDVACTATDAAGNEGSDSAGFKVDQTAPSMTGTASPAPNSAGWNKGDVLVSYTCSDATSGLDPAYGNKVPADGCWADDSVVTDGLTTFHRSIVDNAGNVTAYDFSVRRDSVAPTITGSATPAANADGWNRTDVEVDFTCLDGLSTIASCVGDTTLAGETDGQTVVGTATDKADNTSTASVGPIRIDRTAPEISATRTPANADGWNNGAVTVTFHCTDDRSGVDQLSDPVTVDTEGADQSATGTCTDKAGNTATLTVDEIDIDLSAPAITGSRTPAANANGWNNGAVTVSFVCSDTGPSGIATDTVAGATLDQDGADQSVTNTGACTDAAGNSAAPATVAGINIDTTDPVIAGSASPAANANGWNNTPVTVGFACADVGAVRSGVDTDTVAGATLGADGADQAVTSTGECVDRAGNAAAPATVGGIDIDRTAPVVTASVTPSPVVLGGPAAVQGSATDGLSGVDGSVACGSVSSAAIGTRTVTCTATDRAGNTGTREVSYAVVYGWSGFFQPIDNGPANGDVLFNKARAGQSIPAKFSLGGNQGLDVIAAGYPKVTQVACSSAAEDLIETYAASTANNGLVYDATANQYNYVWKTQAAWANTCRKFDLALVDGSHHTAYFKFTK